MTSDLAVSIFGYFALIGTATLELLLVGRLLRGRGRMVVLAFIALLLGVVAQIFLLRDDLQLCVAGLCWRSFVRSVQYWVNSTPWLPLWLGKFTNLTLANALFLLAGPWVALALAGLSLAIRRSESLDDRQDRRDRLRQLLIGRSMQSLHGCLFWSAALIGSSIVWLAAANPRSAQLRDILNDLGRLMWAAPILSFGLLWGASRVVVVKGAAAASPPASEPAPRKRIQDLFDEYVERYKGVLLYPDAVRPEFVGAPDSKADASTMIGRILGAAQWLGYARLDDMRQALDGILAGFWKELADDELAKCPIFEESLTFLHFILFAELVLSCQDRGGSTLLLAPEASLERIEDQLRRALSIHFAGYTQRIWNGDSEPQWIYDVLIVSPERIEADILARDDASIRDALDRLELVIVLDYQNIDASLLRIRLARLRRLVGKRTLGVVCQSEPRAGLQSKLANTISVLMPVTPERVEIAGRSNAERYWLFWANDRGTLRELLQSELEQDDQRQRPLEVVSLTLIRALRQNYSAVFFDTLGRVHRAAWTDALANVPVPDRTRRFLDAGWQRFPDEGDRVVVIEDLFNVLAASRKNMNFMHHGDCLTHVVSHNYPMRGFLLDKLRQEAKKAANRPEGWSRLGETYSPIAANPTGGPMELAIDLATEFIQVGRVKQRDIEARYGEILRGGVTDTLEIAPTKRGLENLFAHQRDFRPEIMVTETFGHETEFEIKIEGRPHLEPGFLVPVLLGPARRIAFVDQQDEGLTFVKGSMLQIRGYWYEVMQVSDNEISVQYAELPDTHRPLYLFARQYVIKFEPRLTFLEDKAVPAAAMGRPVHDLRLLLRGTYERQTVAMALANEISFDLHRGWESVRTLKFSSNASIMLVRFALAANHPQIAKLDAASFSRLAFTLAATLQDTLKSFFPTLSPRLAVLSPQAGQSIEEIVDLLDRGNIDTLDQLPINLYPRLIGEHHEVLVHEDDSASDAERRIFEDLARRPAPERLLRQLIDDYIRAVLSTPENDLQLSGAIARELFSNDPNRIIDLIVVEDASHDRGGVRALFESPNWANVVAAWTEFLQWIVARSADAHLYYRFGRERVPKIFAFNEAAEFLVIMGQEHPAQPAGEDGRE